MSSVVVYSTDYCVYCSSAKRLLDRLGIEYMERNMGADPAGRERLVELSGRMTFPQIFIDGQPIGGHGELARLVASGGLDHLRRDVPDAA